MKCKAELMLEEMIIEWERICPGFKKFREKKHGTKPKTKTILRKRRKV